MKIKNYIALIPTILMLLFSGNLYAFDLGDTVYMYDGESKDAWTGTVNYRYYAQLEIEDIRGSKVQVRVKGHCWKTHPQFGQIGCWNTSFDENKLKVGDLKWVNKSDLTDSYRDKL
jgi:hypothetical protein